VDLVNGVAPTRLGAALGWRGRGASVEATDSAGVDVLERGAIPRAWRVSV
jgi:hypothetical protein